ncbi:hypothetical protein WM40_07005 [Robbsia andropogonis]|uniref:Uncharacterized protein n=1 Tax=Robbsia andropogonis TaxID=28092 RepID=A0A0F5K284_9BURK|nr:hypothetical protein [Robbsia andropogonis]KKB64231.1 hypothetical protein WM40_07005 [Robbsia andropogonis]MCP1118803.1 hypothetical protein [Robbsia andropogonis]MCP1128270.1 hypothetical protein [Robbsia andropogonis]
MNRNMPWLVAIRRPFQADVGTRGPRAADGKAPRAKHPMLWFVMLYGGGVGVTLVVAMIFHVLVFSAA